MSLREVFARWLLRGVRLEELRVVALKVGANTISLSPAGVGDVARWSATQAAVAAGDIGMNTSTGKPSFFVAGAARTPTMARIVSSGTFAVPASIGNHTVATFTRSSGERVWAALFAVDAAVTAWSAGDTAAVGISHFFQNSSTTDEYLFRIYNSTATARTVDWAVYAEAP